MVVKKPLGLIIVVFSLILVFHAWSLMRFPVPLTDEAWLTSRAWSYLHTGKVFGPLDEGVFDRFEGYWTFLPWFPTWIQSLGLRIFDSPELLPVRIISLIFGMILLLAVYSIGFSIDGYLFAITSVLLVAFSKTFMISAHIARMDIISAALGYGAIALILRDKFSRWWVGLVYGVILGIAFEIHPHSAIFIPAVVFYYFWQKGSSSFKSFHFWSFILGFGLAAAFYVFMHVLPYPQTFLALNKIAFFNTHTPPILTGNPYAIVDSIIDIAKLLFGLYLLPAPLILISLYFLLRSRTNKDKIILYLVFIILVSTILLMRNKIFYYGILFTPPIDLLLAALLVLMLKMFRSKERLRRIPAIVPLGIIIGNLLISPYLTIPDHQIDYHKAIKDINGAINPSDVILAHQVYWFGLIDHKYYSWEEIIYYQRYAPGSTIREAFSELKPDIIILDDHLRGYITEIEGESPYSKYLRIPAAEFDQFINDQASLIKSFDGGVYGKINIYRIDWTSD